MTLKAPNINSLWGALIIEELIRNGIDYFCISPGSRSSPLTIAAARNTNAKTKICFDERAAAYHGIGYSRASGKPAVLISTSGTAAANYLPAIIESSLECLPLIVLTADRPPELRFTGANQTIDQVNLFGKYVRWHFDMPCPDESIKLQTVLTTVDHAVHFATAPNGGPVHLNCMYREPLAPSKVPFDKTLLNTLQDWEKNKSPFTKYINPVTTPDNTGLNDLVTLINQSKKGLLVVGRLNSLKERDSIVKLSEELNWPVFADITSGLRTSGAMSGLIHYCDQLLLSDKVIRFLKPDIILHIGGQLTSKRFLQFIEKYSGGKYVIIKDHPFRHDPAHKAGIRIESSISHFCNKLGTKLKAQKNTKWFDFFVTRSEDVNSAINRFMDENTNISEPAVARLVSRNIPENNGLFLASSMPVRDMDMYAVSDAKNIFVGSNRGASGIDGTIASATGFAAGIDRPTTLVIGDLAFIHDMNSLTLLKSAYQPIIVIVINNNGGGIFSFLPVAEFKDIFETYFGTPHDYSFENIAKQFNIFYNEPKDTGQFVSVYKTVIKSKKSAIIEIKTDRKENVKLHKTLQNKIISVLAV